ncbi:MAG: NAD-dependent malic enzyme [Candidatus Omnitrophica bacterium]|nr:NAD-dependent malic enzyme [Candidatus Omnitrophota bacterium]MDD5671343.1 NAD-dependent malic enzyme [Candidatus Omnitrophota bacterium]
MKKIYVRKKCPKGVKLLRDPMLNKGTAFDQKERETLGLLGFLPSRVNSMENQVMRVIDNLRRKSTDLERYVYLTALHDRNKTLFYRVLIDYLEEVMPIVYTPTVGQACLEYGHIFRSSTQGLFLEAGYKGRIRKILKQWPYPDVRVIVVTDGERILGLGDLGVDGMGIPVGKLMLYTACAGIHPQYCLPVVLDVGTNNESLLKDPMYIGMQQRRLRGEAYDELVEEFVTAAREIFPHVLIQFEDFANENAFRLLQKYRERACVFNDDIQGTASVALAGLYSAVRIRGGSLKDQKILFVGAGEAGLGTGNLIVAAMRHEGLSETEARRRCLFVDSKGLVVSGRNDLDERKREFAFDGPGAADALAAVELVKPTALIGASGRPGIFSREILEAMARLNPRPVVFAMSNPTSRSECTAEQAYGFTQGRAIFASGSPFAPVQAHGRVFRPGQSNNAYIFPGMGLGIMACRIRRVTDQMFFAAAKTLAGLVSEEGLACGSLYPPLNQIRKVSLAIAEAVVSVAYRQKLAGKPKPEKLREYLEGQMYEPKYEHYV